MLHPPASISEYLTNSTPYNISSTLYSKETSSCNHFLFNDPLKSSSLISNPLFYNNSLSAFSCSNAPVIDIPAFSSEGLINNYSIGSTWASYNPPKKPSLLNLPESTSHPNNLSLNSLFQPQASINSTTYNFESNPISLTNTLCNSSKITSLISQPKSDSHSSESYPSAFSSLKVIATDKCPAVEIDLSNDVACILILPSESLKHITIKIARENKCADSPTSTSSAPCDQSSRIKKQKYDSTRFAKQYSDFNKIYKQKRGMQCYENLSRKDILKICKKDSNYLKIKMDNGEEFADSTLMRWMTRADSRIPMCKKSTRKKSKK